MFDYWVSFWGELHVSWFEKLLHVLVMNVSVNSKLVTLVKVDSIVICQE